MKNIYSTTATTISEIKTQCKMFSFVEETDSNVIITNPISFTFNNKCTLYYSKDRLKELGVTDKADLANKYVLYTIFTPKHKFYIGETDDIGERMNTHIKDARSIDKPLYNDLRECGIGFVNILYIGENKEDVRDKENKMIMGVKNAYSKKYLKEEYDFVGIDERKYIDRLVKEVMYNEKN